MNFWTISKNKLKISLELDLNPKILIKIGRIELRN
jgi:hypothetical protein